MPRVTRLLPQPNSTKFARKKVELARKNDRLGQRIIYTSVVLDFSLHVRFHGVARDQYDDHGSVVSSQ